MILEDNELISLFYEHECENYLYCHMLNVLIISIDMGMGLDYNRSKLSELGLAAFLHDIGMGEVENTAFLPRKLSDEEYAQIKKHTLVGAEILSKVKDVPQAVIDVIKLHHEHPIDKDSSQLDGKEKEIREYTHIVAVADVYEALTHNRAYRNKYPAHEAVKIILTQLQDFFDPNIIRVLVNKVGVYPINSWVELSNNEIGRVIAVNERYPLRPVLSVIFGAKKERLDSPHIINLAQQFDFFIKRTLADEEVTELIKGRA
jgi:putative nucleotidyltransferase with HDIG domain